MCDIFYPVKTIRKRVWTDNKLRTKTLYECMCKWGTQTVLPCYLFDYPEVGKHTVAIRDLGNHVYGNKYSVRITDIKTNNLIMLEMM